jgi:hypothetical protein
MVGFSEFGPESRQSAFLPNSYIPKIRSFWESAGRLDRRSFLRTPDRGLTIFAPHKRTGYFASLLSPLSGQICENPVAIMNMRQTGDFRRQPLDRRKTPSLTPIDNYRVFPVILPGTAFNAGKPHTDDRPFETRTSAAVAKLRTSATLPIRI